MLNIFIKVIDEIKSGRHASSIRQLNLINLAKNKDLR